MLANEPKGVGGVRPADVKGILKGNSSSPGSPRTTSPPPHVEGDEAPASPTTNEASRTRTVRFLGESRMGTTFPTRDAPRKSRAGRPASAEAPAVLSARSPRRSEGAKPEAVAPRQSFLVQPCGGHTGTDFVREALLRRGWAEVPGARDSQHVRRCLALSRGLKFVWLRGGDPITSDYPAKMAAVSNRNILHMLGQFVETVQKANVRDSATRDLETSLGLIPITAHHVRRWATSSL